MGSSYPFSKYLRFLSLRWWILRREKTTLSNMNVKVFATDKPVATVRVVVKDTSAGPFVRNMRRYTTYKLVVAGL